MGRRVLMSRLQKEICLSLVILNMTIMASSGADTERSVGYDHRALLIDAQRRFLISGSIHYPRSTPDMWPNIIKLAKNGGLDVIDTYVFWNAHEPQRRQYNFEGRYDLIRFLRVVADAGLLVNLRIGPYVCAEWNLGGFPEWLIEVPGIEFRTDNEPFKEEMKRWIAHLVNYLNGNKLFYPQGGPIIMTQIENEYGHVAAAYGEAGKRYSSWAADIAQMLPISVPWIMCLQTDAPAHIINTCNGFYCNEFTPNSPKKPKMWTENYPGWLHYWGQSLQARPVEDLAFSVARFFQSGGSYMNYYMYHGGTNFDRTAARFVTTSYDYTAPIDEYGQARQPMWEHLKNLHEAIKMCVPALAAVSGEPLNWLPVEFVTVDVYQTQYHKVEDFEESEAFTGVCAAFLSNTGPTEAVVPFRGSQYHVPAWSVSILPDCQTVVFNTMQVPSQTSYKEIVKVEPDGPLSWNYFEEAVGAWNPNTVVTSNEPQEQFDLTRDRTDYLWYTTTFQASQQQLQQVLMVEKVKPDTMQVFVNGKSPDKESTANVSGFYQPLTLSPGHNTIDILSVTSGRPSSGAFIERKPGGIMGSVKMLLEGHLSTFTDLTHSEWSHQVGLRGENLSLESPLQADSTTWSEETIHPPTNRPLMWYKTELETPAGDCPVLLDLGSMNKGVAWINGQNLGRYWSQILNPSEGCESPCEPAGKWHENKCVLYCGSPSQRWYHVPRSWLKEKSNVLVLFEEVGGNPEDVSFSSQIEHAL